MKELYAKVTGRVQGVFYRAFVKETAERLGLVGYVKNVQDGSVEVVAQGNAKQLEALSDELWEGSGPAKVENVECEWREPSKKYVGFQSY